MHKRVLVILMVSYLAGMGAYCLDSYVFVENITYEYPVLPGTKEWTELSTLKEKYRTCQIPEEILSQISTKNLVDVVLEFPLFHDIYKYQDMKEGFDFICENFNGVRELLHRENAPHEMVEQYRSYALNDDFTEKDIIKANYLQIILAQDFVMQSLKEEEVDILRENVLKVNAKKRACPDYIYPWGSKVLMDAISKRDRLRETL